MNRPTEPVTTTTRRCPNKPGPLVTDARIMSCMAFADSADFLTVWQLGDLRELWIRCAHDDLWLGHHERLRRAIDIVTDELKRRGHAV